MATTKTDEALVLDIHRMDADLDALVQSVWGDFEAVGAAIEDAYQSLEEPPDGTPEADQADVDRGALCNAQYCVARAGACLGWAMVGVDQGLPALRDAYRDMALLELKGAKAWCPGLRLPRGLFGRCRAMLSLMGRYKRALGKAGVDDQLVSAYRPGETTTLLTGGLGDKGLGIGNVVVLRGKPCR